MPISARCPECGASFRVADEQAGKSVRCAECGGTLRVPDAGDVAVTANPAAIPRPSAPPQPPGPADDAPRRRRQPAAASGAGAAIAVVLGVLFVLFLLCGGGAAVGGYLYWTARAEERKVVINNNPPPLIVPMPIGVPGGDGMKKGDGIKKDGGFDKKIDPFPGPPIGFDGINKDKDFFKDAFKDGFGPGPVGPGPAVGTALTAPAIQVVLGADGSYSNINVLGLGDPLLGAKNCKVYQVQLEAGRRYQIDMISAEFDTYLFLYHPQNQYLTRDDDSGGNLNARITWTANATGPHRIYATYFGGGQGNFKLTIRRQ